MPICSYCCELIIAVAVGYPAVIQIENMNNNYPPSNWCVKFSFLLLLTTAMTFCPAFKSDATVS